jgi:hypothetical protein
MRTIEWRGLGLTVSEDTAIGESIGASVDIRRAVDKRWSGVVNCMGHQWKIDGDSPEAALADGDRKIEAVAAFLGVLNG